VRSSGEVGVRIYQRFALGIPQGQKDSLKTSVAQLRRGLDILPEKEAQLTLRLRVKTDEAAYEFVKKGYNEASILKAKQTADIGVVSPAFASASPVKPMKVYYEASAFTMALMGRLRRRSERTRCGARWHRRGRGVRPGAAGPGDHPEHPMEREVVDAWPA